MRFFPNLKYSDWTIITIIIIIIFVLRIHLTVIARQAFSFTRVPITVEVQLRRRVTVYQLLLIDWSTKIQLIRATFPKMGMMKILSDSSNHNKILTENDKIDISHENIISHLNREVKCLNSELDSLSHKKTRLNGTRFGYISRFRNVILPFLCFIIILQFKNLEHIF